MIFFLFLPFPLSHSFCPPFICASSNIFHHCSGKTEEMDRLTLSGRQTEKSQSPKLPKNTGEKREGVTRRKGLIDECESCGVMILMIGRNKHYIVCEGKSLEQISAPVWRLLEMTLAALKKSKIECVHSFTLVLSQSVSN